MVIMLIGVSFNAIAAYGLIFGRLGLPALGLRGAGIAAALTNFFLFVGLLGFILRDRQFRRFHILGRLWRPDWARFRAIWRLGLPIGNRRCPGIVKPLEHDQRRQRLLVSVGANGIRHHIVERARCRAQGG